MKSAPSGGDTRVSLFTWGANSYGQLGLGHKEDQPEPTEVNLDEIEGMGNHDRTRVVTGGGGHSLLIDSNGSLFSCGNNNKHQLGHALSPDPPPDSVARSRDQTLFTKLADGPTADEFVEAACGWEHSVALTKSGALYGCGDNAFGQVTFSETILNGQENGSSMSPKLSLFSQCGVGTSTCLESNGYRRIACGARHTLALRYDVLAANMPSDTALVLDGFGSNKKGQLGITSTNLTMAFTDIVCGFEHSAGLTEDGRVAVWGCNKRGQLGVDPATLKNCSTPAIIDPAHFNGARVVAVRSGWSHLMAVTETGRVFGWGRADYGQLGCPSTPFVLVPREMDIRVHTTNPLLECGSEHTIAVSSEDGNLYSWGWNEHGMCGLGAEGDSVLAPTLVSKLQGRRVLRLGTGAGHCLALVER